MREHWNKNLVELTKNMSIFKAGNQLMLLGVSGFSL